MDPPHMGVTMKKIVINTAAGTAFALAGAVFLFWPAKESNAQGTSRPLPGEQCTSINRITICTYKFDDGVRCMFAGDGGQMNAGPSLSVSCVMGREGAGGSAPRPGSPTVSPVG